MLAGYSPEDGLRRWNVIFPYDYWWRRKYNVPFGSLQHLQISQIDIYLEWMEDKQLKEYMKEYDFSKEKEKLVKQGVLHTVRESTGAVEKLTFADIDLSKF